MDTNSIPLEEKEWKKKPTSTIGVSQIWESPHISQSHCISNHRQKIIRFFGPVTTVCIFIIFTNMEVLRWSCHFLKKEKNYQYLPFLLQIPRKHNFINSQCYRKEGWKLIGNSSQNPEDFLHPSINQAQLCLTSKDRFGAFRLVQQ